jgi:hypothetical protein
LQDQFGEQGIQMADAIGQQGLPDWLFSPVAQQATCAVLTCVILIFLVLLPVLVLLRADLIIRWDWGLVLVPLWLANVIYIVVLAFRVMTRTHDEARGGGMSIGSAAMAIFSYLLLVASQVLPHIPGAYHVPTLHKNFPHGAQVLTVRRLDDPESDIKFILAVAPLLVTFLPSAFQSLINIGRGLWQRWRPVAGIQPPTFAQMMPSIFALTGRLLLGITIALAALKVSRCPTHSPMVSFARHKGACAALYRCRDAQRAQRLRTHEKTHSWSSLLFTLRRMAPWRFPGGLWSFLRGCS